MRPQYGNSAGRNKGKTYKKLTGGELATPESEKRGRHFMNWYNGMNAFMRIRNFDPEIAADTVLQIYDDILYKDLIVQNYKAYYLRAYHTIKLKRAIAVAERENTHEDIFAVIDMPEIETHNEDVYLRLDDLCADIMQFVRVNYSARDISLFEIYTGLYPDIDYAKMSRLLGISEWIIAKAINEIKRDLKEMYTETALRLRSML